MSDQRHRKCRVACFIVNYLTWWQVNEKPQSISSSSEALIQVYNSVAISWLQFFWNAVNCVTILISTLHDNMLTSFWSYTAMYLPHFNPIIVWVHPYGLVSFRWYQFSPTPWCILIVIPKFPIALCVYIISPNSTGCLHHHFPIYHHTSIQSAQVSTGHLCTFLNHHE